MIEKDLKMCFSKKKFSNYDQAERLANKLNQRVYFCPVCQNYHLTSSKNS